MVEREDLEMASMAEKPHAILIPYPAQGHITPMLKLAKLLFHEGFFITFVNTEVSHRRLLKSRGLRALDGLPGFQFRCIPDGLPYSDSDATQDIPALCKSISTTCVGPLCSLISELNGSSASPPVSRIVADGVMTFALGASEKLNIPIALLWTASACGLLGYLSYPMLIRRGLIPLKDTGDLTNGYLETIVDGIPGMKNLRLRDLPTFLRTADINDIMLNFFLGEMERVPKVSAIIMNTYEGLEHESLNALSSLLPPIYPVGPLHLLEDRIQDQNLKHLGSNLWMEESECINWLNKNDPDSVLYVNFGSLTVLTPLQLVEFAWGLANTQKPFLWITRPDLVDGDAAVLPAVFTAETRERGLLARWCRQEEILKHPSVAAFLTHSGWNSTIESLSNGVPVISWPFFAEQQTNCLYSCTEWGVGLEIDNDVKRDEVEKLVREVMEGEKGKEMKKKAMEFKRKAEESINNGGSSYRNFQKVVGEVLKFD